MAKYYFVTTLLPQLTFGVSPEINSRELDFILKLNLTTQDWHKVIVIRRLCEIENIRRFWQKKPIEPGGNYDEKEIEEHLLHLEGYPSYVYEFMERYPDTTERVRHFPELLHTFFTIEIANSTGFVHDYLLFEWHCRLIFTLLRAKELKRDVEKEFLLENLEDPFIEQLLQQNGTTFELPTPFQPIKIFFESHKHQPLALHLAIAEWRFDFINNMVGWHTFDIDCILGYVVELGIIEQWMKLDRKKGLEIAKHLTM